MFGLDPIALFSLALIGLATVGSLFFIVFGRQIREQIKKNNDI